MSSEDQPDMEQSPTVEEPDLTIEELEGTTELPDAAVVLQGAAATPFLDILGEISIEGVKTTKRARSVYRLVPRKELQAGLDAGRLRWATPRKGGDLSPLIKDRRTGRIAGHADLKGARPSALNVLGPVAWQAMAIATQQHFLVEINSRLAGIEGRVDELLARDTDTKLAELHELREEAKRASASLARGIPPTEAELRQWLHRAGVIRKELARRAERASRKYLTGELPAVDADEAFALAAVSVQVLAELSSVYGALPMDSPDEMSHRLGAENSRLEPAQEMLRAIASTLDVAHHRWEMQHAIYEKRRPRARVVQGVNKVSPMKLGVPEPEGIPLSPEGAERTQKVLGLCRPASESVLVEIGAGGEVRVALEARATPIEAPGELSEDDIERSVTHYDGRWWALGKYGPYQTREGAVTRLRCLRTIPAAD